MAIKFSHLNILVIDDDAFTRALIRRLLRDIGVRSISECDNGRDGLMEVVRARPDLVLCDVHMTPMNGKQLLQGVRNIKVKGVDRTPVVFLTGDSDLATVQFAKDHAVNGYLVKPVSLAKLRDAIETALASAEPIEDWRRLD